MTKLYALILIKGPAWTSEETPESAKLQVDHVEYQISLRKSGKTLLVGPFIDDGEVRGMTIFKVNSEKEVKSLIDEDPAVKAGVLLYHLHPWMIEKEAIKGLSIDF
ncbi:MAG: YciI family protein [Ignavibacteriaceae bacterium]